VNHPVSQLKFRRFLTEDNRIERSWHATPRFPEQRYNAETDLKSSLLSRVKNPFVTARLPLTAQLEGSRIAPRRDPSSPPGTP
jgi:hypothetical protein